MATAASHPMNRILGATEGEVLETRESKSRKSVGIVTVRTTGLNQDGTEVITFKRTAMVYRRGQGPTAQPLCKA